MNDIREQLNEIIETAARHATGPEPAELHRRLRHRRQRRAAVAVALALGVGIALPALHASQTTPGTGSETPPVAAARGTSPKPPAVKQLTCQGVIFPETALSAPPGAERGHDPAAHALATFLTSDAARDPFTLPKTGWKQLTRDNHQALYGLGKPGTVTFAVAIQRHGTQWKWTGYGGCRPQVVAPGLKTVAWRLPRLGLPAKHLPPDTRVIPIVFVTDGGCSSKFDHVGVETTTTAVTITVYMRPVKLPPGTACARVGLETQRDVALPEPLGRRALLDGSTVPAAIIQPAAAQPRTHP